MYDDIRKLLFESAGLISLIWNIITWFRNQPRIRVEIKTNIYMCPKSMQYKPDDRNIHDDREKGIIVEIVNVGNFPTTIASCIIDYKRPPWFNKKRLPNKNSKSYQCDVYLPSFLEFSVQIPSSLPFVLKTGETWSGFYSNQTSLLDLNKKRNLYVGVNHSLSKKPKKKKLIF